MSGRMVPVEKPDVRLNGWAGRTVPPLSRYDQTVPHPPAEKELALRFARLRELRPAVDLTAGKRRVTRDRRH